MTSPTHRAAPTGSRKSPRRSTATRRQRPGRRAADRAGDDRRRGRRRSSRIAALEMSTLRRRIDDPAELAEPNVIKVVVDRDGFALYFSRAPIPFTRAGLPAAAAWRAHRPLRLPPRMPAAARALPPTALERAEALEQLRALEHGIRIKASRPRYDSIGVDTPDDLERVRVAVGGTALARRTRTRSTRCTDERHAADSRSPAVPDSAPAGQVHPGHRRRGLVARQGPGGRLDRRAARGPRLQGRAPEVRSRTSTSIRAR